MTPMKWAFAAISISACAHPQSAPAASTDAGTLDAPSVVVVPVPEAGAPEAAVPTKLVLGPRLGDPTDDPMTPAGPGLILASTDLAISYSWAREQIGGTARAGDVVVLSAGEAGGTAQFIYDSAQFRSAQNVIVPKDALAADVDAAAALVDKAELVYIAGGDQSTYVTPWRGTALATAISNVWTRGGVVGGTSAGALVLGEFVYDATATGLSENVMPEVALADPFDPKISFTRKMLAFPPLAGAITEVHFEARNRMGRIVPFMARQQVDGAVTRTPKEVLGIAVSDNAAVAIDRTGLGRLLRENATARAFVIKGGAPAVATAGQRLSYPGLRVLRFDDPAQRFDFTTSKWCGNLPSYPLDVAPNADSPFGSASPYDRPGTTSPCP